MAARKHTRLALRVRRRAGGNAKAQSREVAKKNIPFFAPLRLGVKLPKAAGGGCGSRLFLKDQSQLGGKRETVGEVERGLRVRMAGRKSEHYYQIVFMGQA